MLDDCASTISISLSFSGVLSEEAKRAGVHVTALCPGSMRTEFWSDSKTERLQSGFSVFVWLTAEKVGVDGLAVYAKGVKSCSHLHRMNSDRWPRGHELISANP